MKKIKLLVSLCIVSVLSMAIVNEVVKIENTSKAEIAESIEKEKDLLEYENKNEQSSRNIEDNVVESKESYKESGNIEKEVMENEVAENKVIVKENDNLESYSMENGDLPNRGNNPSVEEENTTHNDEVVGVSEIENHILIRVNTERATNGLSPLINNNTMQKYARLKSKDMGDREYFDHKNPEGELITEQMKKDGVTYEAWDENIDYIQGNFSNSILADNFMNNWMKSEEHR
ncbi:MAG: CAP domain-containing protein, partial [Clostridium sp.]